MICILDSGMHITPGDIHITCEMACDMHSSTECALATSDVHITTAMHTTRDERGVKLDLDWKRKIDVFPSYDHKFSLGPFQ